MKIVKEGRKSLGDLSGSMTDICFLLIIFFLVAAVFINDEGLVLFLPNEDFEPQKKLEDKVLQIRQIRLLSEESIIVDTKEYPFEEFKEIITPLIQEKIQEIGTPPTVILQIGDDISYSKAMEALSVIEQAGVEDFTITSQGIETFLIPINFSKKGNFLTTIDEE